MAEETLSAGAVARVQAALAAAGISAEVREFPAGTRTAAAAAAAIGTAVARIVKSLVFLAGDQPILVLASGTNRIDTQRLAQITGLPVRRADADRVRQATGFAIGGVPPLGHAHHLEVYVDRDLLGFDLVWAAAGTPTSVFSIRPVDLVRATGGRVEEVAEAVETS